MMEARLGLTTCNKCGEVMSKGQNILYEWLKDNFKSFFNHGDPDWEWVRGRLKGEKQ